MKKILLDTDIGGDIDDALCLAYLLKEPQCNLVGITTVCGEPEKRAAIASAICKTVKGIFRLLRGWIQRCSLSLYIRLRTVRRHCRTGNMISMKNRMRLHLCMR